MMALPQGSDWKGYRLSEFGRASNRPKALDALWKQPGESQHCSLQVEILKRRFDPELCECARWREDSDPHQPPRRKRRPSKAAPRHREPQTAFAADAGVDVRAGAARRSRHP